MTEHPKCTSSCKHYRVGFTDTDGTIATRHPPACEHPSRPAGSLDVVRGEARADCPLRRTPFDQALTAVMVPAEYLNPPGSMNATLLALVRVDLTRQQAQSFADHSKELLGLPTHERCSRCQRIACACTQGPT